MAFPFAAVASIPVLPVRVANGPATSPGSGLAVAGGDDPEPGGAATVAAFDGSAVAPGFTLLAAGSEGPEAEGAAAESADAPPRLLT